MSPSASADEATVRAELSEIARQLADAEAALAAEQPVDLAGLEDRVADACAGLQALPAERAHCYTPALSEMIDALDRLGEALAALSAGTDEESAATPAQARRAQAAYGRRS